MLGTADAWMVRLPGVGRTSEVSVRSRDFVSRYARRVSDVES
jgi:hypothetical protein